MSDFFQNYHKHKVLSNVWILWLSLILAVSANMFVLSGSTGESLKASVLESTVNKEKLVDFQAIVSENSISFSNAQIMKNVQEISFSLAYNSEILEFLENSSPLPTSQISVIGNESWFSTYIISLSEAVDINKNSEILKIDTKKLQEKSAFINLINVNFTDSAWEVYLLSTKGILF